MMLVRKYCDNRKLYYKNVKINDKWKLRKFFRQFFDFFQS